MYFLVGIIMIDVYSPLELPPTLPPKVPLFEFSPKHIPCNSTYMVAEKYGYHHPRQCVVFAP
jgi:hypothetical protein